MSGQQVWLSARGDGKWKAYQQAYKEWKEREPLGIGPDEYVYEQWLDERPKFPMEDDNADNR